MSTEEKLKQAFEIALKDFVDNTIKGFNSGIHDGVDEYICGVGGRVLKLVQSCSSLWLNNISG